MRIEAEPGERELAHIGAPDDHRARPFEARDGHRVLLGGGRVGQHRRAGAGRLAFDVEQVLHRYRNARERRQNRTGGAQTVVRVGGRARRRRRRA